MDCADTGRPSSQDVERPEGISAQERFWRELYQRKFDACYLNLYLAKTEHIDRCVSIAIALISTGSLGIWAIFKQFEVVWASIIVLSQIVAAIKRFLPYRKRLTALAAASHEADDLVIWAEEKWFDIANGDVQPQAITKLRSELQKRSLKIERQCFPSFALPDDKALIEEATNRAIVYLENFYGTESWPANHRTDR